MDDYRRRDYDDMSPENLGNGYDDKKFRVMKRTVSFVIFLFIVISITGIYLLIRHPGDKPAEVTVSAADTAEPKTAADSELFDADALISEEASNLLDSSLTDEQKKSLSRAESTPEERAAEEADNAPAEAPEVESAVTEQPTPPAPENSLETSAADTSGVVLYTDYTVAAGDTVNTIAAAFSLQPQTIIAVNDMGNVNDLRVGRRLSIPDRDGLIYVVQSGDNLSKIAYSYDMGYVTLAEINGLTSQTIFPGDRLFIPGKAPAAAEEAPEPEMQTLFIKPVEGNIFIHFHETPENPITGAVYTSNGINIETEMGTPVTASMAGRVITVIQSPLNLGKQVVIDHGDGFTSLYAHLDSITVEQGDSVAQGDAIGSAGNTGEILMTQLYFELRKDSVPVDPEMYF